MAKNEVRIAWETLQAFTKDVFVKLGMPPEDAQTEAEVLVWANLRGVDSHGVLRIPSYMRSVQNGNMNPKPDIRVTKETPATLLVDCDHAFGPVVTVFAMERVIEKARQVGIGWAVLRNTTHQGAIGYYPLIAVKQDMAGIALVCSPPNTAPYGARVPGVHNAPIAIGVPAKTHRPLLLDMATSVAAGGKVMLARDKGIPMPLGWAIDKHGNPTTDPAAVGALLPTGGYKGSGLAIMFESLSGIMVGNPLLGPVLSGGPRPNAQNSVVAAIDISVFTDVERYKADVDTLIEGLKALPTADGFGEVMVPGEPEDRTYVERRRKGIPLPGGTVSNLRAVAAELGVELPPELQ
jgi:LDH2 family malate/lactate/ureidoglycolate dehydrogenase